MRFNELRETLQLRLVGQASRLSDTTTAEAGETPALRYRFTDEELRAVLSLLAGLGVVWELKFGSWVLLQSERINAYAQAVIQTLRADARECPKVVSEMWNHGNSFFSASGNAGGRSSVARVFVSRYPVSRTTTTRTSRCQGRLNRYLVLFIPIHPW